MLTVTEAAAIASKSEPYIRRMAAQKRIKSTRFGRQLAIDESSLRAWMTDPAQHKAGNPNFKSNQK